MHFDLKTTTFLLFLYLSDNGDLILNYLPWKIHVHTEQTIQDNTTSSLPKHLKMGNCTCDLATILVDYSFLLILVLLYNVALLLQPVKLMFQLKAAVGKHINRLIPKLKIALLQASTYRMPGQKSVVRVELMQILIYLLK